jgi:ketosteroid isomerase-like protein
MSSQNVAAVRRFFDLFDQGRLDDIKQDLLAEDFEWIYHGPAALPWAGVYRGAEGFDRFFAIVHELIDVRECVAREYLDAGDDVVVLGHSRTRILHNDAEYRAEWMNVFRLRDGRIHRYLDLFDTAAVVEALNRPRQETPR